MISDDVKKGRLYRTVQFTTAEIAHFDRSVRTRSATHPVEEGSVALALESPQPYPGMEGTAQFVRLLIEDRVLYFVALQDDWPLLEPLESLER